MTPIKKQVNVVRKTEAAALPMGVNVSPGGISASTQAPPDKRKVRHDKKRDAYLAEAMGLVVQDGVEGLTIARLASRMNASVGAVYRYFDSKEALLVGLQEMAIADFHHFMLDRLARSEPRLAEASPRARALARLMIAFSAYVEHAASSPRPHRLVDTFLSFPEAVLSDEEARSIGERLLAPILGAFAELLEEAVAARAIEPGNNVQRTYLAWAFVHGLDHFHKRDRISPVELQVKALLPIARAGLMRSFGAEASATAEAERLLA